MALDKLVDSTELDSGLEDIANAIRVKSGGSNRLVFPTGFITEIQSISTGGGGTDLGAVMVYVANFVDEPPTVTSGAVNSLHGYIVGH